MRKDAKITLSNGDGGRFSENDTTYVKVNSEGQGYVSTPINGLNIRYEVDPVKRIQRKDVDEMYVLFDRFHKENLSNSLSKARRDANRVHQLRTVNTSIDESNNSLLADLSNFVNLFGIYRFMFFSESI